MKSESARGAGSSGELFAERFGRLDDARPHLRRAHDAAQGRHAAVLQKLGHRGVGGNHQALDDVLRAVVPSLVEPDDSPVLDDGHELVPLKFERAAAPSQLVKHLRYLVLKPDLFFEPFDARERLVRRAAAFEPRAYGLVVHLRAVVYDAAVDLLRRNVAAYGHGELHDDREPVNAFAQRGQVCRKLFGEHREDFRGRVDGDRVRRRAAVNGRALGHVRVNVRDAHEHAEAALDSLGVLDLIEVFGLAIVYRRPQEPARVSHAVNRLDAHALRLREFALHLRAEVRVEARLRDGAARDCVQVRRVSLFH